MEDILKNFDLVPFDLLMIGVGTICFVLFWRAFDIAFARHFIKLHQARHQASTGAEEKAAHIREKAASINAEFELKLDEVRLEEFKKRNELILNSKSKADALIAAAEEQAQGIVKNARSELQNRKSQLTAQVLAQAEPLALDIAERIKRGEGAPAGIRS